MHDHWKKIYVRCISMGVSRIPINHLKYFVTLRKKGNASPGRRKGIQQNQALYRHTRSNKFFLGLHFQSPGVQDLKTVSRPLLTYPVSHRQRSVLYVNAISNQLTIYSRRGTILECGFGFGAIKYDEQCLGWKWPLYSMSSWPTVPVWPRAMTASVRPTDSQLAMVHPRPWPPPWLTTTPTLATTPGPTMTSPPPCPLGTSQYINSHQNLWLRTLPAPPWSLPYWTLLSYHDLYLTMPPNLPWPVSSHDY